MSAPGTFLKLGAAVALFSSLLTGCESTESDATVSGEAYYAADFYDPWYYGDYYYPPDVIVTPPPERPDVPPHPAHPIYRPSGPSVNPLPSIPSTPRPALRR
jgi:hypothetical protein